MPDTLEVPPRLDSFPDLECVSELCNRKLLLKEFQAAALDCRGIFVGSGSTLNQRCPAKKGWSGRVGT